MQFLVSDEGQSLLQDPAIGRMSVNPSALAGQPGDPYVLAAERFPARFDATLSGRRYELVSLLFDEAVTYRLPVLQSLWARVQDAEGAALSDEARDGVAKARRLLGAMPVGEAEARDPDVTNNLTRVPWGVTSPLPQAALVASWRAFFEANVAQVTEIMDAMRREMLDLQRQLKLTTIFVTHDQEEANTICDRIAVMNDGVVQQVGSPVELYDRPANLFVANFLGTANILDGALQGSGADRHFSVAGDGGIVPAPADAPDGAKLVFRPQNVMLVADGGAASPGHARLEGDVLYREFLGGVVRYGISIGSVEITVDVAHQSGRTPLPGGPDVEDTTSHAIAAAAADLADTLKSAAIIAFTSRGTTASRIARKRPVTRMLAVTPDIAVARQLALLWGAHAVLSSDIGSYESMVEQARGHALREGFANAGDLIVVVAGIPFGQSGSTNNVRAVRV